MEVNRRSPSVTHSSAGIRSSKPSNEARVGHFHGFVVSGHRSPENISIKSIVKCSSGRSKDLWLTALFIPDVLGHRQPIRRIPRIPSKCSSRLGRGPEGNVAGHLSVKAAKPPYVPRNLFESFSL